MIIRDSRLEACACSPGDSIQKENDWVEKWARSLTEFRKDAAATDSLFSPQNMENAMAFMQFYQKSLADIDERRAAVANTLKGTDGSWVRMNSHSLTLCPI